MKSSLRHSNTSTLIRFIKEKNGEFRFLEDTKDSHFWSLEQKKRSLALFHKAAKEVPAYKHFLKKNRVNPEKIKSWDDFQKVPITNKKKYLKRYPLNELCWGGDLNKPLVFTSTSGSTGTPTYFVRSSDLDWQYSLLAEEFLQNSLRNSKGETLVIICFGMGVWIGGLISYKAFEIASQRLNTSLSLITPGINKTEIFNALKNLSLYYKNLILVGYPPFIKDIIDEAPLNGLNLKKLNVKFVFAAEAFTESFRNYLVKKVNLKNSHLDTMNIYGTAEIGAMAYETPLSILIRRIALKKPELFRDIFGGISKTPTLAQFNPLFINFECINGAIVITGNNEMPLIRYGIGDHGGVFSYKQMETILKKHGVDIESEAKKGGLAHTLNELPFVFVFERIDFSVTLYGLQVYPETIRETLFEKPFNKFLSGKFTLITKFTSKHNQYIEINIEMKKDVDVILNSLQKRLLRRIVYNMRLNNSEFRELSDYLKEKANPKLVFWRSEAPEFFKPGVKQKWVRKI